MVTFWGNYEGISQDFIVTLYNPKTHEVVGYRYFGLDDPAYLVWFGEIGVHEFAYLVKNYVAAVN